MSYPTSAIFFDKDNKEIAKQHVNVGHVFNVHNLAMTITTLADVYDAVGFKLYHYVFPTYILRNSTFLELIEAVQTMVGVQDKQNDKQANT